MNIYNFFQIAYRAMRANLARTALTVLGIVIGISSIVIVYSAGEGINSLVLGEIESFGGTDLFQTEIKVPTGKKGQASEVRSATAIAQGVQITTLTLEDMEDVSTLPNVKNAYAAILDQGQVNYGNEAKRAMAMGVTSSFVDIDRSEIIIGRFFTDAEDRSLSQVAILGHKLKENLFGDSDPIGKWIKFRNKKFRVIGVFEERGSVMTFDFDSMIYLPVRTLQKKVMGVDHVVYMMHQVENVKLIDETAEEARYILRENHNISHPEEARQGWFDTGKDDFRVVTMQESMEIMETITGAVTLLLLAIVAISLLVGGVGIMNIMYVVVSERTAEIGLRKAVGAQYSAIMFQFLVESVLITIVGGIIGIVFGILASFLISIGAQSYGLSWDFVIPLKAYLVALGFSIFFGIIFGLFPARKAAKLDPITAMRKE